MHASPARSRAGCARRSRRAQHTPSIPHTAGPRAPRLGSLSRARFLYLPRRAVAVQRVQGVGSQQQPSEPPPAAPRSREATCPRTALHPRALLRSTPRFPTHTRTPPQAVFRSFCVSVRFAARLPAPAPAPEATVTLRERRSYHHPAPTARRRTSPRAARRPAHRAPPSLGCLRREVLQSSCRPHRAEPVSSQGGAVDRQAARGLCSHHEGRDRGVACGVDMDVECRGRLLRHLQARRRHSPPLCSSRPARRTAAARLRMSANMSEVCPCASG